MLLSTQTDLLGQRHGDEEAIRLLAETRFDAFDFSFFQMFAKKDYEMNRPDFREYARRLREVADECGIRCNQAHAPFASSTGNPERDEEIFQAILRSMEAASILGAKTIVVHPIQHLPYVTHVKELKKLNMAFYRRLIPYCEKWGIQVACENMWQRSKASGRIVNSVCASPQEFCEYLDTLDSPWVVACLDIGHVALVDYDLSDYIQTLGNRRLQALHVHDNDLYDDTHTLPFTQKMEFAGLISALRGIGYRGDFTFEADNFLRKMPPELEADALCFLEKVGRYFVAQITG